MYYYVKQTQIEAVQRAVRDFHSLDGALKGQGGDAIRGFYKDTHEPFLIFLHQTLTNYKQALEATSEAIASFESHSDGYVSQDLLLNDVKEGYDQVGDKAKTLADEANHIIDNVQDIVYIKPIDETEVMDSVTKGKEKVDTISEEFIEADKEGASRLKETQDDLKTMQTFLSEMSTKFDSSASISNYSIESTQDMEAYQTMKDYINNKDGSVSDADDKLDNMSMTEIEEMHGKKLNQLNPDSQDQKVLNDILNEYKHGNINREKYLSLIEEYSANKHFSEKTYGDLKTLGITALTTNSHGIAAGIKHYANESMAVVDKAARGFSTVLKGGTYAVGTTYGMYDDLANNDKTVGEAIAHNGTSIALAV